MASGVGDVEPDEVTVAVTGASIAPPPPVGLRVDGAGVRWTRRSRAGWRWLDRVEAPLGEEAECYRVTIAGGRELVVTEPFVALTAGELAGAIVTVRQVGSWAESPAATLII